MKKNIYILLFLFFLSVISKADEVRDFEIEGISIGNSLLDFFSETEIKNFLNYDDLPSDMTYRIAEFYNDEYKMNDYDYMQVYYKPDDKEYIIYGLVAGLRCKNSNCQTKYENITDDLKTFFKNSDQAKNSKFDHPDDKTGKSIVKAWSLELSDGYIHVNLNDWSKEMKQYFDNVSIEINLNQVDDWIRNNWGLGN